MLDRKPRRTERFRNFFLEFYRSKSDHNSGSQTSLPKDAKKRRDGILELSSSSTRFERGRKDGMQEGFSMPQSYKKRKDGVQEGVSQPELVGSNSADGWVHKKLSLHTAYPPPPHPSFYFFATIGDRICGQTFTWGQHAFPTFFQHYRLLKGKSKPSLPHAA